MTIEDKFKKVTGHDIYDFFDQFVDFVQGSDYQDLITYYNGEGTIVQEPLDNLDTLVELAKNISGAFIQYKNQLTDTSEYFFLLERFEEVSNKLYTISNLDLWLRSSITNTYVSNAESTYIQKQNETLEQVSKNIGDSDPKNDWADIALRNNIAEEDYTTGGGVMLQVALDQTSSSTIDTTLGSLSDEKIYGTDLDKKITFEDNDLKILSTEETVNQSFEILLNLVRGQVPEFPEDGISKGAVIGRSAASVMYPTIFRQLAQLFQKNDSFSKLSLIDIKTVEDGGFMEVQATTKLDETISGNVIL